MSKETLVPWIGVNGYMDDEYRQALVKIALRHWPQASKGLAIFG
jgi:hypothetical protein